MTSAVDHRQPIIALGKRRNLDINNPDYRVTGVCKKRITKAQSVANHTITEKAFESLSLVASGIATTKPEDHVIIDIDEFDNNNELAQVEYVEEIYIYLSLTTIARTELQLVGIGALLISSNYEEIWPLPVDYVMTILDTGYSREEMLAMEKSILSRLDWYLSVPTPYVFTVRYTKASLPSDKEMEDMVFFYAELGLLDYKVTIRNNPSKLAASAVYAARCTFNKTPAWTETLKHYTGYGEDQLRDCAKRLVRRHALASENKLKAVYNKYVNPDRSAVSLCPPATSLLVVNRHK
ncbi:cyclin [Tanacetum coccineum]